MGGGVETGEFDNLSQICEHLNTMEKRCVMFTVCPAAVPIQYELTKEEVVEGLEEIGKI